MTFGTCDRHPAKTPALVRNGNKLLRERDPRLPRLSIYYSEIYLLLFRFIVSWLGFLNVDKH